MNPRNDFIRYVEDLARRHVQIAHEPGTDPHFFLELSYEQLMGNTQPNNTGWNLVLMGYETATDDNKHGRRVERIVFLFDVLKHVPRGDVEALQATYDEARAIGEQLLARMEHDQKNPCDADVSEGIVITYSLRMGSKRTMEVGPRWDHYYGYRFQLDLLQEMPFRPEPDPAHWRSLTP